jgi:hypothetical protein
MPLILPRLPQTEPNWSQWQVWWDEVATAVETAFDNQEAAFEALEAAVAAIAAAQAAADAAQAAADSANAAADNAQDTADAITAEASLSGSYVSGLTLSASDAGTDATITVSAHTRHYTQPDGSTDDYAVLGGNVTGLAYDTLYYLYYDDAARDGGAATYVATTVEADAAQVGDRHTVGAIRTPVAAAPPTSGSGTRPPGTRAVDLSTL